MRHRERAKGGDVLKNRVDLRHSWHQNRFQERSSLKTFAKYHLAIFQTSSQTKNIRFWDRLQLASVNQFLAPPFWASPPHSLPAHRVSEGALSNWVLKHVCADGADRLLDFDTSLICTAPRQAPIECLVLDSTSTRYPLESAFHRRRVAYGGDGADAIGCGTHVVNAKDVRPCR